VYPYVRILRIVAVALLAAACNGGPSSTPPPGRSSPPSPPPTESPGLASPLRVPRVDAVRVATLEQPLALATHPDDDATLYVAQKTGQVVALRDGEAEAILDLSGEVSDGFEQGLLGLAFSPDGSFLYVNFTDVEGDTRVVEYAFEGGTLDEGSRREVLFVDQPFSNHNGGHLAFGPDGFLYVGLGDGGSAGDPEGNAQNLGTPLGKMLRIDPRPSEGRPYSIPEDNPFLRRQGARPEIWAYGLRNPWRYSFDRATGDLWIGDVGQSAFEEIDLQASGSGGGENYGWDRLEGDRPFEGEAPRDAVAPIYAYGPDFGASVIGGYVYRGERIPELRGVYVFADFYNASVFGLIRRPSGEVVAEPIGVEVESLSSFGEDSAGELYALSLSGPVYRLVPR
jgi:glucose/arabinose dehydrogenase